VEEATTGTSEIDACWPAGLHEINEAAAGYAFFARLNHQG